MAKCLYWARHICIIKYEEDLPERAPFEHDREPLGALPLQKPALDINSERAEEKGFVWKEICYLNVLLFLVLSNRVAGFVDINPFYNASSGIRHV